MQKGRITLHIGDPNAFKIPTAQSVSDELFAPSMMQEQGGGSGNQIEVIFA